MVDASFEGDMIICQPMGSILKSNRFLSSFFS